MPIRPTVLMLVLTTCLAVFSSASTQNTERPVRTKRISWTDILKQNAEWYGTDEAVRIADNVLLYQRDTGGWPKNIDMARVLTEGETASLGRQKRQIDSNIDNGATHTQLVFLARIYQARKLERHQDAFLKGVDYLLKGQYENGGWPQYFPNPRGYHAHITFNDGAMIGVMKLLRDIAQKKSVYAFVDDSRRSRAGRAVEKGIELILKSQVVVKGQRTVWGAQHNASTLAPEAARTFEPVSLVSAESVGIVRFLIGIDQPSQRVIDAVESAVAWFEQTKINGIRWIEKIDTKKPGSFQMVVMKDKDAEPIWARFYEIGSNRPIFVGRDGVIKYSVEEIEEERRNGYHWYVEDPAQLINKDYPAWLEKWPH